MHLDNSSMKQIQNNSELFCKEFKNNDRRIREYKGFKPNTIKLILEYSFSGFLLKISTNHQKLQFDIYLHKHHPQTNVEIDVEELTRFSSFYGSGFNLILI